MRMTTLALFVLLATSITSAQAPPEVPRADRVRIAEAFRLAEKLGNRIWPDWDKAPFAILLVTPEHEFLMRHPKPSADFTLVGDDVVLGHKVWFRNRKFTPDLLATFPAVGGVPTVVIGQAENTTAKTPTAWVVTLLHEHFHQLQNSQPRYYADVDALGLARGDQTGMWMLNYAFSYAKTEVKERFSVMCKSLGEALQARGQRDFQEKVAAYLEAKRAFQSALSANDWKYFSFQLWQEGIARYTEYRLAKLAGAEYAPGREFQMLKGYTSYKEEARAILTRIEKDLAAADLAKVKRTAFYAVGAAEGIVLDEVRPGWQKRYFEDRFFLDGHFRPKK